MASKIRKSLMFKHQKHVACSYDYKLACVDDNFSKPLKSYLGEESMVKLNVWLKKASTVLK